MFQINCLNPISRVGLEILTTDYKINPNVEEAEGILVRSASMHEMEMPKSLLAIARAGAGTNNIPVDKCAEKGIVVFNTPGANANGVKELVLCGMLLASRDVVGGIEWVHSDVEDENIAKTAEKEKKHFAGTEIAGKKLGVIGLGAIGVMVANAAINLGMQVYGYDPYVSVNAAWNLSRDVKHAFNLDEIYKNCDYITIHVPLMDSTKHMINKEAINKMKDDVILLNFARDQLVDEREVLKGILAKKIRKYVTDFPNPITAGQPGCIVIPHLGASTEESEDNCAKMAVEELMDYLENGNIRNSVNYPNFDMGPCNHEGRIAIFHKNIANMITKLASALGEKDINIANMMNKSKGDVAYTMFDIDSPICDEVISQLEAVEGVFKVRVVK